MQDGLLASALLARLTGERGTIPAAETIADALIEKAAAGDARAFEIIRNTIGENPKDRPTEPANIKTEIRWIGR